MEATVTEPGRIQTSVDGLNPDAIRRAIRRLWEQNNGEIAPGVLPVRARHTCVLNLVIVLPDGATEEECAECVKCATCAESAFTIVLAPDARVAPDQGGTRILTTCRIDAKSDAECCERIILKFAPAMLEDVAQTVEALFVADLRRFVWWRREIGPENRLLKRIAHSVDRLVVDTKSGGSGSAYLNAVLQLAQHEGIAAVSDLNWGRLTRWRDLTAQVFDPPERRHLLGSIAHVELTAARPQEGLSPVAPLLYLGWLASTLGWTVHEMERVGASLRMKFDARDKRNIEATLHLPEIRNSRGRIVRFSATFHDPDTREVSIDRNYTGGSACVQIGPVAGDPIRKTVGFPALDLPHLLANELNYVQRDHVYLRALESAAALLVGWES
jgi:glucose-6-phosphate dehydrogenase assembly protein OpcA